MHRWLPIFILFAACQAVEPPSEPQLTSLDAETLVEETGRVASHASHHLRILQETVGRLGKDASQEGRLSRAPWARQHYGRKAPGSPA